MLILLSVAIARFSPNPAQLLETTPQKHATSLSTPAIHWRLLQTFDLQTRTAPDPLIAILGKVIRIPGFAVPLSDGLSEITEFLLVPNQMACIHVPPPPPNLMVMVRTNRTYSIRELTGPLWLEGTLTLTDTNSIYGAAVYQLTTDSITPYRSGAPE